MRWSRFRSLATTVLCAILISTLGLASDVFSQQCAGQWSTTNTDPYWRAYYVRRFDAGGTHRLFLGGQAYYGGIPQSQLPVAVHMWNGQTWEPVVLDVGGACTELEVFDDGIDQFLYCSGHAPVDWARVFKNGVWSAPPPGMFAGVAPFAHPHISFNDGTGMAMYGAYFPDNGQGAPSKWNGTGWTPMGPFDRGAIFIYACGSLIEGSVRRLVVAGEFETIGGVPAYHIAKWTGSTWEAFPVPPGMEAGIITSLCTFDDGSGEHLFVGGSTAPGFSPVLKWTGSAWETLGSGPWSGLNGGSQVNAMRVHDDGRGPALYVAGLFSQAGGVSANNIARWDGHIWEALGAGIGFQVYGMESFTDQRDISLFATGTFTTAGAGTAESVAQWIACPVCYPNCDQSSAPPLLNVNDFLCFMNKFAMQDPFANCDQSSASPTFNVNDFQCFLNRFAAGCP